MPVNTSLTYVYVDAALNTYTVNGSTLRDRGFWNINGFYNARDVVQIGKDLYIARASSQGQPPTAILDARWSTLIEVTSASGTTSGTDAYARSLAQQALTESNQNGTEIAYILTQLGTSSGTGVSDGTLANEAWILAQYGTNTGTAALTAAASASSAAASASTIAVTALTTAWTGTNIANGAYVLAEYGTNTGTYALQVAQEALSIAIIGTNTGTAAYVLAEYGTNTGTYALQVAQEALSIAVVGTNTATAAYVLAEYGTNTGTAAYVLAEYATNTGTYALQVAQEALGIAIIGTNSSTSGGAIAFTLAQYATNTGTYALQVAQEALGIAIVGTNSASSGTVGRALMLCAAYTPLILGGDSAEVPVPYATNGTTPLAWNVRRSTLRVQTAGTGPAIQIEKSTGAGAFSATVVTPSISMGSNAYEVSVTGTGTMASGDKCRFNVLSLGSALNWTVVVELANP